VVIYGSLKIVIWQGVQERNTGGVRTYDACSFSFTNILSGLASNYINIFMYIAVILILVVLILIALIIIALLKVM